MLLARAVHKQLPAGSSAVPIYEIARALDIREVRYERLNNIEGALITTPERDCGSILLNSNSSRVRRRYTLAHELLHFLNPLHQQTTRDGFECRRSDLAVGVSQIGELTPHQIQEIEANRFAIEVLAPLQRMAPFLQGPVDLQRVLDAAELLELSKEATARRYVELNDVSLAVVFSRNGAVTYFDRDTRFPWLALGRNDAIPTVPIQRGASLSAMVEVAADAWLGSSTRATLCAQRLLQEKGHAMTLLMVV